MILLFMSMSYQFLGNCLCEYQVYHGLIAQAEIHIIKEEFPLALQAYQKAFSQSDGFAKDYINATTTAAKSNDTSQVFHFLEEAVKHGMPPKHFKRFGRGKLFQAYHPMAKWTWLKRNYDSLYSLSVPNPLILEQLKKSHQRDQRHRSFPFTLKIFDKVAQRKGDKDYTNLLAIIDSIGYPGQHLVGNAPYLAMAFYPLILMIHHKFPDGRESATRNKLFEEYCKGNLETKDMAWIIDRQNLINGQDEEYGTVFLRSIYNHHGMNRENYPPLFEHWDQDKINEVNKARMKLGLLTIEDASSLQKKGLFTGF